jgi:hypothetical protein
MALTKQLTTDHVDASGLASLAFPAPEVTGLRQLQQCARARYAMQLGARGG